MLGARIVVGTALRGAGRPATRAKKAKMRRWGLKGLHRARPARGRMTSLAL